MRVKRSETHQKQIEAWEKANLLNQPPDIQIKLYIKAFKLIEQRTLKTLSTVTLLVVLDRVLSESTEKFQLLSDIKIDQKGFIFDGLVSNIHGHSSEKFIEPLHYLLVVLLSVLGNITADILSTPLHQELFKVTVELLQEDVEEESQTLRQINSGRKNSERK